MATKKNMIDSIQKLLTRFNITDEHRVSSNYLNYKIDQVRSHFINEQFAITQKIDPTWLSAPMIINFHKTNYADNLTVTDNATVSKATIPQIISLAYSKDGNRDLGIFRLVSLKNRQQYYFKRSFQWTYQTADHTNSLFKYYDRVNTTLLVNDDPDQLLLTAILLHPEDGFVNNTSPISSGSLVNGTVYIVKGAQIVYDGDVIAPNATFTAGAVATFTGTGLVYLNSEVSSFRDTDPYPASAEMMRNIETDILTREFAIEKGQLTDVRNDSTDDSNKVVAL